MQIISSLECLAGLERDTMLVDKLSQKHNNKLTDIKRENLINSLSPTAYKIKLIVTSLRAVHSKG